MNRPKRPYSVHKRPTARKSKYIYYVRFRNPETGLYLSAVSSCQSSKAGACNWADEQLRNGKIPKPGHKDLTFIQYAQGFWDFDSSSYVRGKLARGNRISRTYARTAEGYVRIHIEPVFGAMKLSEISSRRIESWLLGLFDSGNVAASSINKYLSVFRIMMREAFLNGLISQDPTERVKEVAETRVERGILSQEEVRAVLDPRTWREIWDGNELYYAMNLLAATTGMRAGEIRGLTVKHVHPDRIEVFHAWEEKYGLKGAKWDSERVVPIPPQVYELIRGILDARGSPDPDALVFEGKASGTPLSKSVFVDCLRRALARIGVDGNAMKERNLTFHSWRHYFNSYCRGKVSDAKLRLVTGHRTEEMTDRYTHFLEEDFTEIRALQERIFGTA